MLANTEMKTQFIEYLWNNYANALDTGLKSKCLELSGIYNDFCIFGINANNQGAVYLIPFNQASLASLTDEAGAFWGVSYSSGNSFEIWESNTQGIDRYILDNTGLPFFKFRSSDHIPFDKLNKKLDLYLRVKLQAKKSLFDNEVSVDELVSRFNNALTMADVKSAEVYLQQVENRPEISVTNKIFLRIKYFYMIKNWEGIVNHKHILDLKEIKRPLLITEYILMSIFNIHIRPVVSYPEEALQTFRDKIAPLFSGMILFSEDYKSKEVYLLLSLALQGKSHPGNHEIDLIRKKLNEILDPGIPVQDYLNLLDGFALPKRVITDLDEELRHLDDSERYHDMISLLESNRMHLNAENLKCVQNIQSDRLDVSLARRVSELFATLDPNLRNEVLQVGKLKRMLEKVEEMLNKDLTLNEWLEMVLTNQNDPEIKIALPNLKESLDEQQITQETIDLLHKAFALQNNQCTEEIKSLIPNVISGLEDLDPELITREWKLELLRFICESERLQNRDRLLVQDTLGLLLDEGLTNDEYEDVIVYIELVWDKLKSPKTILWPIEVLEEIYTNPIQNPEIVNKFARDYIKYLYGNRNSLDGSDIAQIESFFADRNEIVEQLSGLMSDSQIVQQRDSSIASIVSFLDSLKIGIYSLEETAAKRAKNYFTALNGQSDIGLNHDKSCTDALKSLSKKSDVFVFASRAAKHAAFYCVRDRELVYPAGKGASSIINAIIDWMKKNNTKIAA